MVSVASAGGEARAHPGPDSESRAGRRALRFLTCGSVDDGKSTLIGRLLYDAKLLFDDHAQALARDSQRYGTAGAEMDFALLFDGLEAEREQGITIDVAYRFFATQRRSFIVADAPGHEQYTRNMATAASTAELAVLLVDARKGLLAQTKRHSVICHLLGIGHVILAVNKIDLVGYAADAFEDIVRAYTAFADRFGFRSVVPIPVSARYGDNVASASRNTGWYSGPTLLEQLENAEVESDLVEKPFRFPIQRVSRPHADFRGYAGTVASGRVRTGDEVVVLPAATRSRIARIVTADGDYAEVAAEAAVTLTLADEVDASRGDLIAPAAAPAQVSDQFAVHLLWMDADPLLPGRSYLMRLQHKWVLASITAIKHRIDVYTLGQLAARQLALNEIGICNLAASAPVAFDPYTENRATGAFILVDRFTHDTVAAGMIKFGLRRAKNLRWESLAVDRAARSALKQQHACVVWFTGLSGAGKSTIAKLVEQKLHAAGRHTYMLDGDNVRHGLNRDLGFSDADRVENIRRLAEVAKLMLDAGLIVLCAAISPFRAERKMARELIGDREFIEVFVDTPIALCMQRDPKGLYTNARAGLIKNFTGFDSPYEPPDAPDLRLDTVSRSPDELAQQVIAALYARGAGEAATTGSE